MITNSRTVLAAQGRLATLITPIAQMSRKLYYLRVEASGC